MWYWLLKKSSFKNKNQEVTFQIHYDSQKIICMARDGFFLYQQF